MQELGIGWRGDGLRLHRRVDRDPLEVLAAQRASLMCHPQALGQQHFQLIAEPFAPMAQVRALVREGMLEDFFAGEELKIRVVNPALAHALIAATLRPALIPLPDARPTHICSLGVPNRQHRPTRQPIWLMGLLAAHQRCAHCSRIWTDAIFLVLRQILQLTYSGESKCQTRDG